MFDLVDYDPTDPAIIADPFPLYRRLRDEAPLHHDEQRGFWVLSRHDDIEHVLRDWRTFSNAPPADPGPLVELIGEGDLLNLDPPRHDEVRKVLRSAFAPAAVTACEPVRARVRAAVASLCDRGSGDVARLLAWPLPVATIADLLGLPPEDVPEITRWVRALDEPDTDEVLATLQALKEQVGRAVASARAGLLAELVAARDAGALLENEIVGLALSLLLAGTATVASLVSNALLVLHRHPDQRRLLSTAAVSPAAAVEELARFESPVQILPRLTTRPVEIHGRRLPSGARVLLLLGSANRDERRWEEPDRLVLARPQRRSMAFGGGVHFCIGAALARMQARVALEEFFAQVDDYDVRAPRRIPSPDVRGILDLPVTVAPRHDASACDV